jgi:hypothetical protein
MTALPRKTVFFSILATAWLALAVIFVGAFVIAEQGHEHVDVNGNSVPTSEDCHICYEIQIALMLIEAFARLGIGIALLGSTVYVFSSIKPQLIFNPFYPITLKVKFNC